MPTAPRRHPLAAALALLLSLPTLAAAGAGAEADAGAGTDATGDHRHDRAKTLDTLEVTATPLRQAVDTLARPVELLAGEELDRRKSGTLGETLERLPGVQSSFFGAGVGRPILRGQDGARVQVLVGGTGSLDASTISADHAVTIEPFLADRIEVLKGPASLLYGSGAIGGAVNVVDGRVPTEAVGAPIAGRAELRHGTAADSDVGMVRLDGDAGALTWHVDGFRRDTGDVAIPGTAFSADLVAEEIAEGEDPGHFARGHLPNSALTTDGGALGGSWLGERGWFGAALSTYRSNYGIPPGAHEHHEDEDGEEDDDHDHEEFVRIHLRQDRLDLRGGVRDLGPLQELSWRYSDVDYEHVELEGDGIGTRFDNQGRELRLEAVQVPIAGWRGAFGLQAGDRDFAAVGDEAFVPPSRSRDLGVFVMQERDFGDFKLELGGRHEMVEIDPDGARPELDRHVTSLAAGGLWKFSEIVHLSVNLDRAERMPTAEELYSDGAHVATQSYEIGDPALRNERGFSGELGLHLHQGRIEGSLAVYRTQFDDYIHLVDTGAEIDELPVRAWTQADARFQGWEAEARIELADVASGLWQLRLFADGVDARLKDGGRLPRIAPGRIGGGLDWSRGGWRAHVDVLHVADQDDVALGETATDGYTLVDAGAAYHWDAGDAGWEAFVEARNLTDQDARVHTSFLKDFAPLPGRGVDFGIRVSF